MKRLIIICLLPFLLFACKKNVTGEWIEKGSGHSNIGDQEIFTGSKFIFKDDTFEYLNVVMFSGNKLIKKVTGKYQITGNKIIFSEIQIATNAPNNSFYTEWEILESNSTILKLKNKDYREIVFRKK